MDSNDEAFVGKAGIRYSYSENHVFGFTFSQAYRPGSVVPVAYESFIGSPQEPYDPEYLDNYEISYRGIFLDGKLRINANLFYLDWTDLQGFVFDPITFQASIENAGDAESKGGELEINFTPIEQLVIYAGLGYSDAKYVEFRSGLGNFDGNEFEGGPKENYVTGFNYQLDKFTIGANAEYTGSYFTDVQNTTMIPSRTVIDLDLTYRYNDNITVKVYADNLLDKRYLTSDFGFNRARVAGGPRDQPLGTLGDPRVIGLKTVINF